MSPRTIFLSRLLGLYFLLIALPMMLHKPAAVEMVTGLLRDPLMMFVFGLLALVAGLAMVLAHNIWSGGVLPVVVTILGWLVLVKGLLFLLLFSGGAEGFYLRTLRYGQCFYLYMAVCLVIGVYLTYAGFTSKSRS